jgi:hypothetical protein
VGFHCLNNVVETLDLGSAYLIYILDRNAGNAFLCVVSDTINNLIERGLNDGASLDDHKLVERIVLVRGTQPTKRIPIQKNVVPNFKVTDEVALNYFHLRSHAVTAKRFNDGINWRVSSNLPAHLAAPYIPWASGTGRPRSGTPAKDLTCAPPRRSRSITRYKQHLMTVEIIVFVPQHANRKYPSVPDGFDCSSLSLTPPLEI